MPLDLSPQLIGLIVLGGLAVLLALAAVCSGADEELEAGLAAVLAEPDCGDVFELSSGEVDDRFAAIAAHLRDEAGEADERICEAHQRNLSELPGIDGSDPK